MGGSEDSQWEHSLANSAPGNVPWVIRPTLFLADSTPARPLGTEVSHFPTTRRSHIEHPDAGVAEDQLHLDLPCQKKNKK